MINLEEKYKEPELVVEVFIKDPESEEKKNGMFKMPFDVSSGDVTMIDIVAFAEMIKSWVITNISPED